MGAAASVSALDRGGAGGAPNCFDGVAVSKCGCAAGASSGKGQQQQQQQQQQDLSSPASTSALSPVTSTGSPNMSPRASSDGGLGQRRSSSSSSSSGELNSIDMFGLRTLRHIRKGQWRLGPPIGKGSFGTVFKGMNEETGQLIAAKALPIASKSGKITSADLASLEREVVLLRQMNHPHVVQYLGVDFSAASNTLFIFSEWVPGGSLRDVLDEFGPLKERVARDYAWQVLLGLCYLCDNNIIHRDIKAANCLIHENGHVKLTDFGTSKLLCDGDDAEHTMRGTPYFMAPEVVATGNFGCKADIWSFGGFVIELLTGEPPWAVLGIRSTLEIYRLLLQTTEIPPLPPNCSPMALKFISRALDRDQARRPSARELLGDDYVNLNPVDIVNNMYMDEQLSPGMLANSLSAAYEPSSVSC
jgi:serine/threonine protein kinase